MSFPAPTSNQARILWLALTALAIAVFLAVLGVLLWALGRVLNLLSPVLWPLAIAGIIAYLLDPIVDFLERKRVPRGRGILLVFLVAVLLVLGILGSIIPRLVFETRDLIQRVPAYAAEIQDRVADWLAKSPWHIDLPWAKSTNDTTVTTNAPLTTPPNGTNATTTVTQESEWQQRVSASAVSWLTRALPKIGSWILAQLSRAASWAGVVVGLALVPVYVFYFLREKRGIQQRWTEFLPLRESQLKEEVVFVLTAINDYLIVFFRGQVLVAACLGVLYTVGFFAVGLHYALLLGLLAGALSIVPYLGAILTIVPATILAAVQYQDWLHPILVIAVFTVVQILEGFVISPKIMGDRVGLHPLTIIISVMLGTTLMGGILGGVLAIPLTAALRVLMVRYVWRKKRPLIFATENA